jgi:ornithine decarboxylase
MSPSISPFDSTGVAAIDRRPSWSRLIGKHGSPLLVLDCGVLRAQYRSLSEALPGVRLHYAIKALPEVAAIESLSDLGSHFEIASEGEIELLRRAGVGPQRVIHTHPIKCPRDIVAALNFGVSSFVVDNLREIEKMVEFRDRVELMLRVSFRSPDAGCDLSRKFGCMPEDVPGLLARAASLGVRMHGLCFHVGSQSATADAHVHAIETCNEMIRATAASGGSRLTCLDIGGGFPVDYDGSTPSIDAFCAPIRKALDRLPDHVTVLAEPGRFLAGPTGDSIDVIAEGIQLPELEIGDLVVTSMMGAYTSASATSFNSLPRTTILALNRLQPVSQRLRGSSASRSR